MLAYEEMAPPPHLAAYVRCFWTLCGEGDPSVADRILPDGSFELIHHRGDPFLRDGKEQPEAMIVGEIRRATVVTSSRRADVFGTRIRIGAFHALTGLHPRDFRDRIAGQNSTKGSDPFVEFSRPVDHPDRRVMAAVAELVQANGDVRIRDMVNRIGTTERTLERLFDLHVGLRPKELARIVRFQASLRGIDGGYYDDSHRIHDYVEFAGVPPTAMQRTEVTEAFVGNLQDGREAVR